MGIKCWNVPAKLFVVPVPEQPQMGEWGMAKNGNNDGNGGTRKRKAAMSIRQKEVHSNEGEAKTGQNGDAEEGDPKGEEDNKMHQQKQKAIKQGKLLYRERFSPGENLYI
jgi:hypothetical protein